MHKELKENDVPILAEKLGLYVHFTKTAANDPNRVRLRCNLYRYSDGDGAEPLVTCSFLCDENADYRKEVLQRAPGKIRAKLRSRAKTDPEMKERLEELFQEESPFATFYKMHYENIVQLQGWLPSTVKKYQQTLNQLIPRVPYKPLAELTAADFDEVIRTQCEEREEEKGAYGESRISQFVIVLDALMAYAQAELLLPNNVVKDSVYYNSTTNHSALLPLDTLIERRLRSKGLEVSEQVQVAKAITGEILSGTAPLAIGTAIQLMTGLRPSEVCALRKSSIMHFTTRGWEDRRYLVVCNKIDGQTGEPSYAMKTLYGYRAVPITKTLDRWLEMHCATIEEGMDTEEDYYLVTNKDRSVPIKSQVLCNYSARLLKQCVSNEAFATLQIPVQMDENGDWVAQEKNKNAYQFRRNYASMLLNNLGMDLCPDVQGMFGHKLLNQDLRRWMLNHEETLIRKMEAMDKLILLPESGNPDETKPWHQMDPRKEVYWLDGHGSYRDKAALKLAAQPYSENDCVTVRLLLKAREPGDTVHVHLHSEDRLTVDADTFLAENTYFGEVNLQNPYLDEVFGEQDEMDSLIPESSELPDEEADEEDESIEDRVGVKVGEEVDEIYDADDEFEGDEEGDDDEPI